jgi:aspartate-semialdehyde dehydrogenase
MQLQTLVDADVLPPVPASFINGAWLSAGEQSFVVRDPATMASIGTVRCANELEAKSAVDAAQMAFAAWADLLPAERAAILRRWHDLVLSKREFLAQIMTAEQGKPISEARGEIDYAAGFIEYYAEEAKRPDIESVTSHLRGAEMELWREPCGVAALVTPWNFPCAMITRKAAAALAAGCTVVIHPSKETPYSAIALASLAAQAGFPNGVFNVVVGEPAQIVGTWTADPRVRVLSFTGSTEIGKLLYTQSASTIKRLILELGGHAPFIVFEDADLERAVACAVSAKFATSGQDCLGANRFLVHRSLYGAFCAAFAKAIATLTLGPGKDDCDIGPLINDVAITKQQAHVDDALARGAKLMCGGKVSPLGPLFYEPTLLIDVPADAKIFHEETFGPVAAVMAFDDEADAIRIANDTEYGLIAYAHSKDPARIYRVSRALQFGMVAINRTKVTGYPIPFGGWKQSGIGREGGRMGLQAFTEVKYVCRDFG